jgi:hypothetical protein
MGGKRAAAKAAMRARLLDIAREAFRNRGYEAVTFRDLAKEAGVSTGSYFGSWASKADLFTEATGCSPDLGIFLERVATHCTGYPGPLTDLAADALRLRGWYYGVASA